MAQFCPHQANQLESRHRTTTSSLSILPNNLRMRVSLLAYLLSITLLDSFLYVQNPADRNNIEVRIIFDQIIGALVYKEYRFPCCLIVYRGSVCDRVDASKRTSSSPGDSCMISGIYMQLETSPLERRTRENSSRRTQKWINKKSLSLLLRARPKCATV